MQPPSSRRTSTITAASNTINTTVDSAKVPSLTGSLVKTNGIIASRRSCPDTPFAPLALQGLHVSATARTASRRSQQLHASLQQTAFVAFHNSSLSRYPTHPKALDFSSKRVRIPAVINGEKVDDVTVDTATDVPCISAEFIRRHSMLRDHNILPVPPHAINLRSADGSPLSVAGYMRFMLTLGETTLPVEAFVLPSLGPDKLLLDNSIMGAFGAILDWHTETMSFRDNNTTIQASHRVPTNGESQVDSMRQSSQCSVVVAMPNVDAVPVSLQEKCKIKPRHEICVRVVSAVAPDHDTEAVIEPRVVTCEDLANLPSDTAQLWENLLVARSVCTWSQNDGSAWVQIANPSDTTITARAGTVVGHVTPATSVPTVNTSATTTDPIQVDTARNDLRPALQEAFNNTVFSPVQCEQILDLCAKYRSVFSLSAQELGTCKLASAEFPLQPGTKPVDKPPYKTNPRTQAVIDDCVAQMERDGIIEQRASPWGSPVCIVVKRDGSPRFCVDYRSTINKHLVRHTWPMPDMTSCIDTVGGAKFISVFDIQSAFWQIPVDEQHVDRTAFVTQHKKYVFKRMPFGIANAPWMFQRIMALTFAHFGPRSGLLVYMDDLIVCSATWESHLDLLERMLQALHAAGLTLKPSKAQFGPKQVNYLGHVITAQGIKISNDRIKAIVELPTPTTIKELRSVLGMVNFVRKFLPDLATVIEPMVSLTRKEIAAGKTLKKHWGDKHDEAFAQVKHLLTSAPVLHFPDFSKDFVVHVDASESGAGAFLAQKHGDDLHIVAYFSKRFSASQRHYSATQKECYALILSIQHWRPYLWGRHFVCVTDHAALRYLFQMQNSSNMLTRWAIALQSFDFTVQHKPGRLHVIPDTLSRLFTFEKKEDDLAPTLAPICRNVPADTNTHTPIMRQPFELSSSNLDGLKPVSSDRELFEAPLSSVRSTSVFTTVDPVKLRAEQQEEYGAHFTYLQVPDSPLPPKETVFTMSHYFTNDGILYRSYLPGNLRKRSTFRDQMVVPKSLVKLVLHACHDHVLSGGHQAFKPTFDKIRDRYWWTTVHRDVHIWCRDCQACQHRKTAHRHPQLPVGHVPVTRPFQRVSIDLVEYKSDSSTPGGLRCKYVFSAIDHLTRFAILSPIPNKEALTVANTLIERIISVFGPPESIHSDQGPEFENKIIFQLQKILGYKKTRTTPYRPQGNSVLERIHSTMHAMLAMHISVAQDNWVSLLPFVQLAHNTSFNATTCETPFFLMFGRQATLPVDIILGARGGTPPADHTEYSKQTRDNLQLAFEFARRNLTERADKQAQANKRLPPYPVFKAGEQVLVYRPHQASDGPNPKLGMPWRGPYIICSQSSPVVYRVKKQGDSREVSTHLAHLKKYHARDAPPSPDMDEIGHLFLGQRIPVPILDSPELTQPRVGQYIIDSIVSHRPGVGRPSPHNVIYRFRFHGYGSESDLESRGHNMPQCHDMISAYRLATGLDVSPNTTNVRLSPSIRPPT